MKLQNIIKSAVALALFATLPGSCTGDFEELNTDPSQVNPADLPFEAQFTTPMSYSYPCQQNLFQFWTNLQIDIYGGYFESPNGGFPNSRYNLNVGHCGGMHENFMQKIFNNTRRLIAQCDESGQADFAAVMRVVEVYNLLNYTDAYGPVPYSSVIEADQLPERPGSYAYDKQEEIYKAMFAQIEKALEGFNTESSGLGTFDIWCNGDRALWKQVANQLKLRMALRMVKVNPEAAKQYAKEAIAAGVLTDTDITIKKGFENDMWLMFNWGDSGANASLITMMSGYEDPRLPLYFTRNTQPIVKPGAQATGKDANGFNTYAEGDYLLSVDGEKLKPGTAWLGIPPGCDIGIKPNQYSYYSGWAGTFTMPQPILFAAEGWFLRAEAKLRWADADAMSVQALYEKGIEVSIRNQYAYRKSFAEQGYSEHKQALPTNWETLASDESIAAYIAGTTLQDDYVDPNTSLNGRWDSKAQCKVCVKWDEGASAEQKLERIITQKWIANFPLSTEAWAEYRRTGYPQLFKIKDNQAPQVITTEFGPRRLPYSNQELNSNTAEVKKGVELLKGESSFVSGDGDTGGTYLWWDVKNKGNF